LASQFIIVPTYHIQQVDQLLYEIPDLKFTKNALCQAPEFLKVFSDIHCTLGQKAVFDCVLLGSPRPKVHWLFNDEKMSFEDVLLEDTAGYYQPAKIFFTTN
jgi:hypothetical protein